MWVRSILDNPEHRIWIAAVTEVEVTSALARRFREGDLSRVELDQACNELHQDCESYSAPELTAELLGTAIRTVRTHFLRAYDAVQLASAIEVRDGLIRAQPGELDLVFVSADAALNDAALSEGVMIENPNAH